MAMRGTVDFYIDEASFGGPRDRTISEAVSALIGAGRKVRGASKGSEALQRDIEDLKEFDRRLEDLVRTGEFNSLPILRNKFWRRIANCRHLTVGPWRGVFLVDSGGSAVAGMLFSHEPHDFYDRLDELLGTHLARLHEMSSKKAGRSLLPENTASSSSVALP
tara:strand:+ start:29627 stop:30115 length:489 start_codon:yes stop_codon:yes gene_type:complete